MAETGENRDIDDRQELEGDEDMGLLLRRLRGRLRLRDVARCIGVSSSYLSQIERGVRIPGSNMIRKLAAVYNVDEGELMRRTERAGRPDSNDNEILEVDRAYRYVLETPHSAWAHGPTAHSPSAPSDLSSR